MEPIARPGAALVDVLDRVLERGLVIDADIIISLAGVPLIGVSLRAALAGVETWIKYAGKEGPARPVVAQQLEGLLPKPGDG